MSKTNVRKVSTDSKNAQVLLRDTAKALKMKTGLKGGVAGVKSGGVELNLKATPVLL